MPIASVKTPDGSTIQVEHPEGASDADILKYAAKQHQASGKPKDEGPKPGETITGEAPVAPSAGGAAEFAKSIPTGIANTAAEFARGEQVESEQRASAFGDVNAGPKVPTGHELTQAFGMHEPKGFWGSAGELTGEFAVNPMTYFGPGSAVTKFLQSAGAIFGGAAGKEVGGTTGQLAGLVGGGMTPGAVLKGASPVLMREGREAASQLLESEGITDIFAGQRTGSKAMKYAEGYLGDAPFAGGRASLKQEAQNKQLTRAIMRRAGEDSDLANDKAIDASFSRVGKEFDRVAAQMPDVRMNKKFFDRLISANDEYNLNVREGDKRPYIEKTVNDFLNLSATQPIMNGKQLMAFRSQLLKKQRGAFADPEYNEALGSIINAIDGLTADWMKVTGRTDLLKDWSVARRQYRNLLTIANAATGGGSEAAVGMISPGKLRQALTSSARGRKDYARGKGDLAGLSHAANLVLDKMPDSGTAQRAMLAQMAASLSGAVGYMLAGGSKPIAEGIAATAAAPGAVGRGIMSKPVQEYFGGKIPGQAAARAAQSQMPSKGMTALRSVAPALPGMLGEGGGDDAFPPDTPQVPLSQ